MKRIIRYTLVALQIVFIAFLVYQFENMEKFADEIKITSKIEFTYYGGFEESGDLYVDYDINKIDQDLWKIEETFNYNRPVYVTLSENKEGIHEVKRVTKKKPKQKASDEVLVRANYSNDNNKGQHFVYYGFESIQNTESYGRFKEGEHLLVTILLGKWGQQKVVNIERR